MKNKIKKIVFICLLALSIFSMVGCSFNTSMQDDGQLVWKYRDNDKEVERQ